MEIIKALDSRQALVVCLDNLDYAEPLLKVGQAEVMNKNIIADMVAVEKDAFQKQLLDTCAIIVGNGEIEESIYDIEVYTIEEGVLMQINMDDYYDTVTTVVVCHKNDVHRLYEMESSNMTHILFENVIATSQLTSQTRLIFPVHLQISKVQWH